MKKDEKINNIIQVRKNEISSMDKDNTRFIFTLLGAWGVVFLTAFNNHSLGELWIWLSASIISIIWVGQQASNYVLDCYDWLSKSIRDDKILIESMPTMKLFESIYYKRRYSS